MIRVCQGCGLEYRCQPARLLKFCSKACTRTKRPGSGTSFVCEKCGVTFHRTGKTRIYKFCSCRCAHLDKPLSADHKRATSETRSKRLADGSLEIVVRGKFGKYVSVKTGAKEHFDSSYELERMKQLDADPLVESWTKKHGLRIPYSGHIYVPDFLVKMLDGSTNLEEVKGWVADEEVFADKNKAASDLCALRGWAFQVLRKADLFVT